MYNIHSFTYSATKRGVSTSSINKLPPMIGGMFHQKFPNENAHLYISIPPFVSRIKNESSE